jgi:hypothetical protein
MRSHFTIGNPNIKFVPIKFVPPSTRKTNRGSHFRIGSHAAMACAVTGATAMMTGICSGQIALDQASNSTYAGGWSAGQNAGNGFGAWSFDGTTSPGGVSDPGAQQTMSSAAPLGTAWTMFNLTPVSGHSGISDTGRAITAGGGLQTGQTFQTVIENPTGYHFYGGFDILFENTTDNDLAGDNTSAIRASVFNYYGSNWGINDISSHSTPLSSSTTAVSGMQLDLTLLSATTYSITLTPLNGATPYTLNGTYAGPINYVNFRLYNTASTGPNDVADNFGISYVEIVPEPSTLALIGLGSAGLAFLRRRK